VCLVGRDRGWSLRSTPGSVLSPRSGWACRNLVVVARGGRSESGERQGGSGWWPVEASPCRAEALGWTGTQGSRCATNPGLGKNVPSGHGGAGAVAVHPRFLAPPSNGNRAETGGGNRGHPLSVFLGQLPQTILPQILAPFPKICTKYWHLALPCALVAIIYCPMYCPPGDRKGVRNLILPKVPDTFFRLTFFRLWEESPPAKRLSASAVSGTRA
jgi:hypothetical protein